MNKIIWAIGLSTLTMSVSAVAAPSGGNTPSYEMYAPKMGGHEIKAGISILSQNTTTTPGNTDMRGTGLGIDFGYAYGFHDNVAFHVDQRYSGYKEDSTNPSGTVDRKGFSGTTLGVKGIISFPMPWLYYDAGYTLSILQKRKSTATESNIVMPEDSRDHLYAQIGVGIPVEAFSFGLNYKFFLFQKTDVDSTTGSFTINSGNGSKWRLFAQYDFGTKLGLAYGEQITDASDVTTAGFTTTNGLAKDERKYIQIYGITPVADNIDLLIDVKKMNLKDESAYSKYDTYLVSLAAKMNF